MRKGEKGKDESFSNDAHLVDQIGFTNGFCIFTFYEHKSEALHFAHFHRFRWKLRRICTFSTLMKNESYFTFLRHHK